MRKRQIVDFVNIRKEASVEDLAKEFCVSVETIRRDLKALDSEKLLIRVHGGAISSNNHFSDIGTSFTNRAKSNVEVKQRLVKAVIEHIKDGMAIGLDASSSSWMVAEALPNIYCTVVTNSINVVKALEGKSNIITICLGGMYSEKYKAFYGKIAKESLHNMSLDLSIISCVGFESQTGVWDSNEYNYEIKKDLIKASSKAILLVDKSKFNKRSLLKICSIDEIDMIVTDAVLDDESLTKKLITVD